MNTVLAHAWWIPGTLVVVMLLVILYLEYRDHRNRKNKS